MWAPVAPPRSVKLTLTAIAVRAALTVTVALPAAAIEAVIVHRRRQARDATTTNHSTGTLIVSVERKAVAPTNGGNELRSA